MVELKIKRTKVLISFTFFASIALFLLTDSGFGTAALCACGLHELSHLILMLVFKVTADEILFYGAGICIVSNEISRAESFKRTLILAAGCAGNIAAAAVLFLLGKNVAAAINLFTAFFNILPIGSLDGAQLLRYFAISRFKPENVDRVLSFAQAVSVVFLIAALALFGEFSFSLAAIVLYIAAVSFLKA